MHACTAAHGRGLALTLGILLVVPPSSGLLGQTQLTPVRTVIATDTTAAGVVADPYRWLEETKDPEVRSWYLAQHRHTDSVLRADAGFEGLRKRLYELLNDDIVLPPVAARELIFFERIVAGPSGSSEAYVVEVATAADAPASTVLDPRNVRDAGDQWNRFTDVAPDETGRLLVVGVPGEDGGATLRVWDRLDVAFRPTVLDAVPGSASWLRGRRVLVYSRPAGERVEEGREEVVLHSLDTGVEQIAFVGPRSGPVRATSSEDGSLLLITHQDPATPPSPWSGYQGPSGETNGWVGLVPLRDGTPGAVQPLLPERDARYRVLGTRDGAGWLVTASDDGFGRVLSVRLGGDRQGVVRTVFQAEDARLVDATLVEGGVAVALDRGLDGRIVHVSGAGDILREFQPPQPGPIADLVASADGHRLYFRWSSFLRRQPVHELDLRSGAGRVFQPVGPSLNPDRYTVRRVEYPSEDGTPVPLFLVHPRGAAPEGGRPTLLYGYGAWGWSVGPWFHQRWATWLDAGGAVAIASVRGGGAYGQRWHDAGRKGERETAVTDLQAAAEWLSREGHTSPDRLGLVGLSAGGPTVASALLRRPELFGAAVLEVPILDVIRHGVAGEFGDPALPGANEADAALAFSPYHQLDDGTCLPPTLLVGSEDDNRLIDVLKFTARAQAVEDCPAPVLMHVGEIEGHLPTGRVGAERHLTELIFFHRYLGPARSRRTGPPSPPDSF